MARFGIATCALTAGLALIASGASAANPAFTDVTDAAGLTFSNFPLEDTPGNPMHGGVTAADFDADGWPDLYVVGAGGTEDRLYINQGDGTFVDEAALWGLTDLYRGNGSTACDYDNDGDMDLFVTSHGDLPGDPAAGAQRLYQNNGDRTFTNVAVAAGVSVTTSVPDGYGAACGDYDLDGDLDLWVGGWHENEFLNFNGTRLFMNNGDGTFTDVSVPAEVNDITTRGFGAIFADMDGDRYPELLVSGDFGTSKYYINDRDGTFSQMDVLSPGSDKVHNGMGTTLADFNRDGKQDWFVTAIFPAWQSEGPNGNRLYINESNGVGDHEIRGLNATSGLNDGGWGWGTAAFDFNHDGWTDVLHTGGWRRCPDPVTGECFLDEPSYLFMNNTDETFTEVGQFYGLDHILQGRGLATLDYDRDGDMDVVITSNAEPLMFFRNDLSGSDTNWIQFRFDTSNNPALAPNGYGTNVKIIAPGGGEQFSRMNGGSNYLGRSELVTHFGVKDVTQLDEVTIKWADGFQTVLTDVPTNQLMDIVAEAPFSAPDMVVRGEVTDLTLSGLVPGETALFVGSIAGLGDGPCRDNLGGICMDILNPRALGTAIADADGVATLSLTIPDLAASEVFMQVVAERGVDGLQSVKSNIVTSSVVDP